MRHIGGVFLRFLTGAALDGGATKGDTAFARLRVALQQLQVLRELHCVCWPVAVWKHLHNSRRTAPFGILSRTCKVLCPPRHIAGVFLRFLTGAALDVCRCPESTVYGRNDLRQSVLKSRKGTYRAARAVPLQIATDSGWLWASALPL